MPRSATSIIPGLVRSAPVNAPRSWPKSSDSSSASGSAAQSTGTNTSAARALCAWIARAISSFPVPDSPWIRMLASDRAAFRTRSNTALHGRALADDVVEARAGRERLPQPAILLDQAAPFGRALDGQTEDVVGRQRLQQVVERPRPHGFDCGLDAPVAGDHDHDDVGIQLEGAGQHLHPIDPGHLEIGEDDLGALALEQRQRTLTVGRRQAGIVLPAEEAAQLATTSGSSSTIKTRGLALTMRPRADRVARRGRALAVPATGKTTSDRKGVQGRTHRRLRRPRRVDSDVFAGVELGHGLEFRAHAIEERFPGIGHRRAGGPATKALPERRLVTDGLDEDETAVRGAGPGPARGAAALARGTSRPGRRRVRSPAPPRPAGTPRRTSGPKTRPSRRPLAPGSVARTPGQHLPDPIRRDDRHADRMAERLRQRALAATDQPPTAITGGAPVRALA